MQVSKILAMLRVNARY